MPIGHGGRPPFTQRVANPLRLPDFEEEADDQDRQVCEEECGNSEEHDRELVEAKALSAPIDQQMATWLDSIDGKLRDRLVKAGLATAKPTTELKAFISSYIDGRHDVKPPARPFGGKARRACTSSSVKIAWPTRSPWQKQRTSNDP